MGPEKMEGITLEAISTEFGAWSKEFIYKYLNQNYTLLLAPCPMRKLHTSIIPLLNFHIPLFLYGP
jgi:hypothetical protein